MINGNVQYSQGNLIGSTSLSIYLHHVDRPMYAVIRDVGLQSDAPFFANGTDASVNVEVYSGTITICDNRNSPEASQIYAVCQIVAQCDINIVEQTQRGISLQVEPRYP